MSSHRNVSFTGRLGDRERDREEVSLCGEDVVINVDWQLALLRKQQVEVFKHLCQEEGVHPTQVIIHRNRGFKNLHQRCSDVRLQHLYHQH